MFMNFVLAFVLFFSVISLILVATFSDAAKRRQEGISPVADIFLLYVDSLNILPKWAWFALSVGSMLLFAYIDPSPSFGGIGEDRGY